MTNHHSTNASAVRQGFAYAILYLASLPAHAEIIPSLKGVTQLAAGGYHTCALRDDTSIECWGANTYGQLGGGSWSSSVATPAPVLVSPDRTVIMGATGISAGRQHTCALFSGMVSCWGNNASGQVGDGTRTSRNMSTVFVMDSATRGPLTDVTAISAGADHTCAIVGTGSVKCWGSNNNGQLGDGTQGVDRLEAVTVSGLNDATSLAAGMYHTCALRAGGKVSCWGRNDEGQLGDGSRSNRLAPATTVVDIDAFEVTDASAIAAGDLHTCVVRSGGSISCWGWNDVGQLGNGTRIFYALATDVPRIAGATEINLGGNHSCALMGDTTAQCWGSNDGGKLGIGTAFVGKAVDLPKPVLWDDRVPSRSAFLMAGLAGGADHTCALGASVLSTRKSVFCWGWNIHGQLGEGTTAGYRATAF